MPARRKQPKKQYARKADPLAMKPVTVRVPDDLIDALNQATIDDGRSSASDMIRVILRKYLLDHGFYNKVDRRTPNGIAERCSGKNKTGLRCKRFANKTGRCDWHPLEAEEPGVDQKVAQAAV